jgi:hypothetical protein
MLMMLPLIRFVTAVQLVAWQEDWPGETLKTSFPLPYA